MANRVLSFPTDAAPARRSPAYRMPSPPTPLYEAAQPEEFDSVLGPQLIHSRRPAPASQAQRIARQVEQEIAHRVQREAAERHAAHGAPAAADRRPRGSSLPGQATVVGLRHRLLDALLFFARPA